MTDPGGVVALREFKVLEEEEFWMVMGFKTWPYV